MSAWPHQPISSLGTVITGSTPKTSEEHFYGGDIPFVTPAELDQADPIMNAARTLSETGSKESRLLPEDTVMVCCIGSLGKVGIAGRTVASNQQINSVIFDPKIIWPRFGFYACRLLKSRLETLAPATTVPIVNKSKFGQLEIPVPPLEEQKKIADILDRAEALRAKRRDALAQLDKLIQSIFIDMFGDPITNPKEWEIYSIGALLIDVTNGLTRRRKESDEGTDIVLRLRDIRDGWIDFSDINRISLSHQESSRYKVSVDDLLFIRVNGNPDYVGRCALFEGFSEPVYFNDHIMRVKTDQSKVNGKFLAYMLNGTRGKREIALHRKTSAGQHTINQDGLSKIEIPLPPLKIQQKFAFRIASIEKLKEIYRSSLAELDELFSSLQYRAFRGEL